MIAKIERVPLRDVWPHENDFTQWLEKNIDVLSEAVDRDIVNVEREKKETGSMLSVDLFAEDEAGSSIIIENQLGRSDHDHLGKLIAYLTIMKADSAVWIVADHRPEHVTAMTWLNESSGTDFYLLKIEAVRIENSPPAALLTLIVGPPAEGESIGRGKQEMSERHSRLHKFWSQFVQHPDAKLHRHIRHGKRSRIDVRLGVRGIRFRYAVARRRAAVEVYIDRGRGKNHENLQIFDQLHAKKDQIEAAFGGSLNWERLEHRQACRIWTAVATEEGYLDREEAWPAAHDRMTDAMNRLVGAIRPHLESLKIEGLDEDPDDEDLDQDPDEDLDDE